MSNHPTTSLSRTKINRPSFSVNRQSSPYTSKNSHKIPSSCRTRAWSNFVSGGLNQRPQRSQGQTLRSTPSQHQATTTLRRITDDGESDNKESNSPSVRDPSSEAKDEILSINRSTEAESKGWKRAEYPSWVPDSVVASFCQVLNADYLLCDEQVNLYVQLVSEAARQIGFGLLCTIP